MKTRDLLSWDNGKATTPQECANIMCDNAAVINVTVFIGDEGITRPLCEMHAMEMAVSITRAFRPGMRTLFTSL